MRNRRLSRRQARVMNNQRGFDKSALYTNTCSVYIVVIGAEGSEIEISLDNLNQYLTGTDTTFRLSPDKGSHTNNGQMNYRLVGFNGKEITSKDTGVTGRMAQATSADIVIGTPLPNDKKLRIIRLTEEAEGNEINQINYVVTMRNRDINADQSPDEETITLEDFTNLHSADYKFTFTTDQATPGFIIGTGTSGAITDEDRRRDKGVAHIRYQSDRLSLMNSIIFRGKTNRGSSNILDLFNIPLEIEWDKDDLDGVTIKDKFLKLNLLEVGLQKLSSDIIWESFWPNEYDWIIRRVGSGTKLNGTDPTEGVMRSLLYKGIHYTSDDRGWEVSEGNELDYTPPTFQVTGADEGVIRKLYRDSGEVSTGEDSTKISFASLDHSETQYVTRSNVGNLITQGSVNQPEGEFGFRQRQIGTDSTSGLPIYAYGIGWEKDQILNDPNKGLYDLITGSLTWWYSGFLGAGSQYRHHYLLLGMVKNEYFTTQQYYTDFFNPLLGQFQYQGQQFETFTEEAETTNKNIGSRDLKGVRADNNQDDRKYLVQIPMGINLSEGSIQLYWEWLRASAGGTNARESSYIKEHTNSIQKKLYNDPIFIDGGNTSRIAQNEFQQNNYPIDLIFKLEDNIRVDGAITWNDGWEITRVDMNAYCKGNHIITYYDEDMQVLRVDTIRSSTVTDATKLRTTKIYEVEPI